jgi:signal transduction histidine kinase
MLLGVWTMTWGVGLVTGSLAGAAVQWLARAVEMLQEVEEQKSRFIATVSHELRTPLTAILGSTRTLLDRRSSLDTEQCTAFLEMIDRQATRQLRLVEDVLTFSAGMADAARPEPEIVDAAAHVSDTLAALHLTADIDVRSEAVVRVDPGHLRQMLTNLLANADTYGEPPLRVRVDVCGDHGVIGVIDHGPGLPGGLDGGLAEPFVQGDSGDRRVSTGVGLGLTICRDLAAANHGTLEYSGPPDDSPTFTIRLPLTSRRTGAAALSSGRAPAAG